MKKLGMEPSQDYPIRRYEDGRATPLGDPVVTEARIELDVNDGHLRLAMLCLPRDLEALAVGFLAGEGALRSLDDLAGVEIGPDGRTVFVRGEFDADVLENLSRRWTWGSGCGSGGTGRDMNAPPYVPVAPGPIVSPRHLRELAAEFQRRADLWRRTGGVHTCALADRDRLLLLAEDVGRHNAFDKVIGRAWMERIDPADKIMLTTGRLSAEIVSKAVASRVPMLASRSAVTSLAIDLARRFGVTLVGFVRGRRLNVYTGFERVATEGGGPSGEQVQ